MRDQYRKIIGGVREYDGRGRGRSRLEADGHEHDLFRGVLPGGIDRLADALDYMDIAHRIVQGRLRARHAQEIPVGADDLTLLRQLNDGVDLGLGGDAYGAPGAHDDLDVLRQQRAYAALGDRILMRAAHVHYLNFTARRQLFYLTGECLRDLFLLHFTCPLPAFYPKLFSP